MIGFYTWLWLQARASIPWNPAPTEAPRLGPSPADGPQMGPGPGPQQRRKGGKKWCLPTSEASPDALQNNIDYVCGLGLDCEPIQEGGACFIPNTVRAHAAYAMNAYFQATGGNEYDCDFQQTATVTAVDPSTSSSPFAGFFFLYKIENYSTVVFWNMTGYGRCKYSGM